jgi:hypothetical protein
MGSYMEIFEARVLGENLYLRQRFTVFKVEYFLYIIHYQCTHPNPEKAVTPKYSC